MRTLKKWSICTHEVVEQVVLSCEVCWTFGLRVLLQELQVVAGRWTRWPLGRGLRARWRR